MMNESSIRGAGTDMDEQQSVFSESEGNAWFRRNREHLGATGVDWASTLICQLHERRSMTRVCELGCANGWRLANLRSQFAGNCEFYGIDASQEAVDDGKSRFPWLHLQQGVLSAVPFQESFDLVIVNFVLHWMDRELLARCLTEIDRLVKWDGYLVLGDFLPDHPVKRHYHHLPQQRLYTYKQDYAQAFLGLGFFRELTRVVFDHASKGDTVSPTDSNNRAVVSVLHKSTAAYQQL